MTPIEHTKKYNLLRSEIGNPAKFRVNNFIEGARVLARDRFLGPGAGQGLLVEDGSGAANERVLIGLVDVPHLVC